MAHRDLGDFYGSIGDINTSLKHYAQSREFCSTSQHVLDMCISVLEVSFLHEKRIIHRYVLFAPLGGFGTAIGPLNSFTRSLTSVLSQGFETGQHPSGRTWSRPSYGFQHCRSLHGPSYVNWCSREFGLHGYVQPSLTCLRPQCLMPSQPRKFCTRKGIAT